MALIGATPSGYDERGVFKPPHNDGPAWAHPAIQDRKLFLRSQDVLDVFRHRRLIASAALAIARKTDRLDPHGTRRSQAASIIRLLICADWHISARPDRSPIRWLASAPPAAMNFTCRSVFFAVLAAAGAWAGPLKINGSTTVNLPVAEAAEILRAEKGMDIQVDTQGGSAGGISMLGEGWSRSAWSRSTWATMTAPSIRSCEFKEIHIGEDAVALIVSKDVWEGGVRSLTKEQVEDIYEGRITNWKDVGGPDRRIAFFNKEPGRGTWEVFVHWVYGDAKKAPPVSFPEVGGNEETRNKVASTRGALSQLSASWADGKDGLRAGSEGDDGRDDRADAGEHRHARSTR